MITIHISVRDLVATARESAMIVSDNTGYQIAFDLDAAWDAFPKKNAVFVWYQNSLPYSRIVPFEGNTVDVPKVPAVNYLLVGVTAGSLQTTTPAQIKCHNSILSSGGTGPEAPTEREYIQLMTMINSSMGQSAYEVAVRNGFEGNEEEWLASLKGDPGPQGPQGEIGAAGADGYTPVKGEDYFTEEEIRDVVDRVLAEIPTAEETMF